MTYDPWNARDPAAERNAAAGAIEAGAAKKRTRSGKGKDCKPKGKVTVSIEGGPPVELPPDEAADLVTNVITLKLRGKGTPMDARGNEEMFSGDEMGTGTAQTVAAGQLRAFIERIERLEEEKKTIADDIKEVFAEAKGTGFDTKAIRTIVRLRRQDQAKRQEDEAILDLYKAALGMA